MVVRPPWRILREHQSIENCWYKGNEFMPGNSPWAVLYGCNSISLVRNHHGSHCQPIYFVKFKYGVKVLGHELLSTGEVTHYLLSKWAQRARKLTDSCPLSLRVDTLCSVHYSDVIMGAMASQITSPTIIYAAVYSGADQRKVISPYKGPVTRKMFPFDDVIICKMNKGIKLYMEFHCKV